MKYLLFSYFLSFLLFSPIVYSDSRDYFEFHNFWVRAVPGVSKVSAAFGIIKNRSRRKRMLVRVESNVSEFVELHTHKKQKHKNKKVLKMRKLDFITIPANGQTKLKRLSYHIMLIGLKKPLQVGSSVKMNFIFDNGVNIQQIVPIKKY